MKLLLVLFLVSFVMEGFCQNLKNSKGKRTGHWIYYGKDRPRSNYPMNSKIEEGRYIDGLKDGIWIKYYPDGKTKKLEGKNKKINTYLARWYHRLIPYLIFPNLNQVIIINPIIRK